MSTVTASASNVERSASFLAKQTSARNTPNNANSQPFAALLMAAEEPEADGMSAVRALQTNSNDDNTDKKETSASKAVAGQDALAGLLNWQALNAAGVPATPVTTAATAATAATASIMLNNDMHSQNATIESIPLPSNNGPELATAESLSPTQSIASSHALPGDFKPILPAHHTADSAQQPPLPAPPSTQPAWAEPAPSIMQLQTTASTTNDPSTKAVIARPIELAQRQATGNPAHSAEWMVNASNSRTPPTRSAQAAHTGSTRPGLASAPLAGSANSTVQEPMALQRTTVELVARAANVVPQNTAERANTDGESVLPDKVEGSRKAGGSTALSPDGTTSLETSSTTRDAQEPSATQIVSADQMTEMLDELTGQIAYWASQGTQKARLTVGDARDGLMEVDVSMRDGEVHVAFEAARDAVSDALINSAESLLRGMLENQGMTLGDVTFTNNGSPGGQQGFASQQSGNGPSMSQAGTTSRQRAVSGDAGTSAMANIPRRPDIATAEKVDLFA